MNTIKPGKVLKNSKRFRRNFSVKNVRFQGTAPMMEPEFSKAKPFKNIPGPKPLPIPFGNMWNFTFGEFAKVDYIELHRKLFQEFGQIVRISGLLCEPYVLLYDPSYVETMFRNDSVWPQREAFDGAHFYFEHHANKEYKDYAEHGGILFKNGQNWYDIRTAVNKTMMRPKCAEMYIEPIDYVAAQFIDRIKTVRRGSEQEMPENFLRELKKWALETIGTVALDTHFRCLDEDPASDSEAQKLIDAIEGIFDTIYSLNVLPQIWKYVSTPSWRKFVRSLEVMIEILEKHVNIKLENTKKYATDDYQPKSVLESMLLYKKDNPMVAVNMCMDMFMAGIDTTSNAAATAMYHMAKNPEKQEKLHAELKMLLPRKSDPMTSHSLRDLKYLRGCLKESMRISPTVPLSMRIATRDYVLADYQIPKGTQVFGIHLFMGNSENYFKHADKFLPERWLKSESKSEIYAKNSHPFVTLPFGFGPRMCLGRRFAELELEILLAKIFRNFKVEYNHGDMIWSKAFLYTCSKPLQFKMIDRPD